MRLLAVVAICCTCLSSPWVLAKDNPKCHDSPLLSRFPDSELQDCSHSPFDAYKMPLEKGSKALEGEHDKQYFHVAKGHTQLEIRRNFSNALRAAGYTIEVDRGRDLVAHKDNVWLWASIYDGSYTLDWVKEKAMQQQVVASAKDLETGINATGHIVANGIFFDTDKAELKPESKPALDEIAKLLKQDGGLRIYVVGHTDNQGSLAHNMELSKARAASVVKALETQYSIPAARLASYGDGPYAPVASNDGDEGRAKNRRVELVKQ